MTTIRERSTAALAEALHASCEAQWAIKASRGVTEMTLHGPDAHDTRSILAASPTLARRLDFATAWEMAEAALPDEDLMLSLFTDTGQYEATDGRTRGYGPTPTDALLALAEKLKEATR